MFYWLGFPTDSPCLQEAAGKLRSDLEVFNSSYLLAGGDGENGTGRRASETVGYRVSQSQSPLGLHWRHSSPLVCLPT